MKKILIVDDQGDLRRLVRMTFEFASHEVIEAANGDECIDAVRRHRPDVVLLDVMMPGRSGVDVVRTLKSSPDLNKVPVVMLTALDSRQQRSEAAQAGADGYVVKPFHPLELLALVEAL